MGKSRNSGHQSTDFRYNPHRFFFLFEYPVGLKGAREEKGAEIHVLLWLSDLAPES